LSRENRLMLIKGYTTSSGAGSYDLVLIKVKT